MSKSRLKRPRDWKSSATAVDKDSRQRNRAKKRKDAHALMSQRYGGEPRKIRRAMALTLAKRKTI